jgi:hypothetical protein
MKHKHFKKINLHLHTYYSDGIYSPKQVVKQAKKRGFFAIAITDHNDISGSIKAVKYGQKYGINVFPGVELYFSSQGNLYELLALFNDAETLKKFYNDFRYVNYFVPSYESVKKVADLVTGYGGVVIAPHPYGRKGIYRDRKGPIIPQINVEVLNAFTGKFRNRKAKQNCNAGLCHEFGAADLHFYPGSLNRAYTRIVSRRKITVKELWENLRLTKQTIEFKPKGSFYWPQRILIQKILCSIKICEYMPRQFVQFMLCHHKNLKWAEKEKTVDF